MSILPKSSKNPQATFRNSQIGGLRSTAPKVTKMVAPTSCLTSCPTRRVVAPQVSKIVNKDDMDVIRISSARTLRTQKLVLWNLLLHKTWVPWQQCEWWVCCGKVCHLEILRFVAECWNLDSKQRQKKHIYIYSFSSGTYLQTQFKFISKFDTLDNGYIEIYII